MFNGLFDGIDDWGNLHEILWKLQEKMSPMCEDLIGLATGIAGFGALLYVAYRVWQALARAEPVDVFSLLRPFALALCIMLFQPVVLRTLNGVLRPLVTGMNERLKNDIFDMKKYQDQKDRLEWENELTNASYGIIPPDEQKDRQLQNLPVSAAEQAVLDVMYEVHQMFSLKQMLLDFVR